MDLTICLRAVRILASKLRKVSESMAELDLKDQIIGLLKAVQKQSIKMDRISCDIGTVDACSMISSW